MFKLLAVRDINIETADFPETSTRRFTG